MRIVNHNSINGIPVKIRSNTKGDSNVAKTWKKYIPYDLVADIYEGTTSEIDAVTFIKDICATMGAKYGKVINYENYDFSTGYFDREHPKPAKVSPDTNSLDNEVVLSQLLVALHEKQTSNQPKVQLSKIGLALKNLDKTTQDKIMGVVKTHAWVIDDTKTAPIDLFKGL